MTGKYVPLILAVDPDDASLKRIAGALALEGWRVLGAKSYGEALHKARAYHPDLVVSETLLPDTDGLRLCEQLRREPATAAIPIMLLSSTNDESDQVYGLAAGADDFAFSGINPKLLRARAKVLMRDVRDWEVGHGRAA